MVSPKFTKYIELKPNMNISSAPKPPRCFTKYNYYIPIVRIILKLPRNKKYLEIEPKVPTLSMTHYAIFSALLCILTITQLEDRVVIIN